MTRIDLYGPVHKGIRALLYDTAARVARTDFAAPDDAAAAALAVRRALQLLDEHATQEAAVITPVLAELSPELHALLSGERAQLCGAERELDKLLQRLPDANDAARESLGRKLHEALGRLVADHLHHMERLETAANRMLWAHRSDEQLLALRRRMLAALSAERLAEWLAVVLPAVSPRERTAVLRCLLAAMPAAALAAATAPARATLGERAWRASVGTEQAR